MTSNLINFKIFFISDKAIYRLKTFRCNHKWYIEAEREQAYEITLKLPLLRSLAHHCIKSLSREQVIQPNSIPKSVTKFFERKRNLKKKKMIP